jgi:hypothetical protein
MLRHFAAPHTAHWTACEEKKILCSFFLCEVTPTTCTPMAYGRNANWAHVFVERTFQGNNCVPPTALFNMIVHGSQNPDSHQHASRRVYEQYIYQ